MHEFDSKCCLKVIFSSGNLTWPLGGGTNFWLIQTWVPPTPPPKKKRKNGINPTLKSKFYFQEFSPADVDDDDGQQWAGLPHWLQGKEIQACGPKSTPLSKSDDNHRIKIVDRPKVNKLAKLRRCASRVSFGSKSLGPINQPPWPTLSPNRISMLILMSMSMLISATMSTSMSAILSASMSATISNKLNK